MMLHVSAAFHYGVYQTILVRLSRFGIAPGDLAGNYMGCRVPRTGGGCEFSTRHRGATIFDQAPPRPGALESDQGYEIGYQRALRK